jgi:hypothetical protein
LLALCGCSTKHLTREETVKAVKTCTDAGMEAEIYFDSFMAGGVLEVVCKVRK